MPVHNREELIKPLIGSLNRQTLNKKNFEVIFVDDGSTDDTINTIKELSKFNYSIIKRQTQSGGAASPRNEGIMAAVGKYIYFVDSDDWIADYALDDFRNAISRDDYDIISPKFVYVSNKTRYQHEDQIKKVHNNLGIELSNLGSILHVFSHQLIYENNLFLNQSMIRGEDMLFTFNAYCVADKTLSMNQRDYYYVCDHDNFHLFNNGYRKDQLLTSRLNNFWRYAYRISCLNFITNNEKKSRMFCLILNEFIIEYRHWLVVDTEEGLNPNIRIDVKNMITLFTPYYEFFNKRYFSEDILPIAELLKEETRQSLLRAFSSATR